MRKNDKKLVLNWLRLLTFGKKRLYPKGKVCPTFFDDQSDVPLYTNQPTTLAVLLRFDKLEALLSKSSPAVRRKLVVMLTDAADHKVLDIVHTQIDIPKDQAAGVCCAEFPIDVSKIAQLHTYHISVYEELWGITLLEERDFHFYNPALSGEVDELFKPFAGAILKAGSPTCYKAVSVSFPNAYSACFFIEIPDEKALPRYPEMEVTVYFHNVSSTSQFCKLEYVRDSFDGKSKIYKVGAPFLIDLYRFGVGFAILSCLGTKLASFAFSTDYKETKGVWRGKALNPMPFSSYLAAERFSQCVDLPDDDDIEALLKEAGMKDPLSENGRQSMDEVVDEQVDQSQSADDDHDDLDDDEDEEDDDEDEDIDYEEDEEDDEDEDEEDDEDVDDMDFGEFTEHRFEEEPSAQNVLDQLTGLDSVRKKIDDFKFAVTINQQRNHCNLPTFTLPLHAMFLGSPGTGKTTVAKALGRILRQAGVLSRGHVVCRERSELLGPNYSNEETNTLDAIKEARGGILFIDEAYQLYQKDDPRDPGRLVIETLITALSDETRRDWMLILAGYPDEMKSMFSMNPGLRSRIPETNVYVFEDFSEAELLEIADNYFARNKYTLTPEAHEALARRIAADCAQKDKDFGNARYVINLIQMEIVPAMNRRLVQAGVFNQETLSLVLPSDVPPAVPKPKDTTPERTPIGFR